MIYKVTHNTKYTYAEPISACHNYMHLAPRETAHQRCEYHRVVVHPVPADREKCDDYFGNQVEYFSIHEPHRRLTITATSRVRLAPPPLPVLAQSPPWELLAAQLRENRTAEFLQASQFTTSSPRIPLDGSPAWMQPDESNGENDAAADAEAVVRICNYARQSFTPGRPVLEAAHELSGRIHADFTFDNKATTLHTPLRIAFAQRRGVCQDFAHVAIACLRSVGLAARYVSGYLRTDPPPGKPRLVGADASHAWVSLFCGEPGWIDLDPTNNVIPTVDHITLAWGRDYNDVCPIRGVFVGGGRHTMSTSVDVAPA